MPQNLPTPQVSRDPAPRVPFPPQPARTDAASKLIGDYAPDPRFAKLGEMPAWYARKVLSPLSRPATLEEWAALVTTLLVEAARGEYAQPGRLTLMRWIRRSWLGPRGEKHESYAWEWNRSPAMQRYRSGLAAAKRKEVARAVYARIVMRLKRGHTAARIVADHAGERGFKRSNVFRHIARYRRFMAEHARRIASLEPVQSSYVVHTREPLNSLSRHASVQSSTGSRQDNWTPRLSVGVHAGPGLEAVA